MENDIKSYIGKAASKIQALKTEIPEIEKAAQKIISTYQAGGKVIIFGNGGSAADSQHIATELVVKFRKKRNPFPAIALTTNTSELTAISNDFNFETVFERQLEALGKKKDLVIAISTSGNSANVVRGAGKAKKMGLPVIVLKGKNPGKLDEFGDILISPSTTVTSHIQECHITVGHILCYLVEEKLA
ncbi:MAG: D-sedoheptulose-7-phosphate isomerase [Elusimicrobiota bacterium]